MAPIQKMRFEKHIMLEELHIFESALYAGGGSVRIRILLDIYMEKTVKSAEVIQLQIGVTIAWQIHKVLVKSRRKNQKEWR